MGRKAVSVLLYNLAIVLTLLLLAAAVLCRHASSVPPEKGVLWSTLALLLPVVLVANGAALVWWFVRRKWLLILFPCIALVINMNFISAMIQLPDLRAEDERVHDIRIATLNVHNFSIGGIRAYTLNQVAGLMDDEKVDVLSLQEFSAFQGYSVDNIADVFTPRMPYFIYENGAAILSRFPIIDHKYVQFPDTNNDYIRADLLVGQDTVRIISVHLQTSGIASLQRQYQHVYKADVPVDTMFDVLGQNSRIRAQQVRDIRALIDSSPYPVILTGDFNDTPSSYTYHTMKSNMTDGFQAAGSGYGGTFRGMMWGLLRIDYIFYDAAFRAVRYRTLPDIISDHKAVVADLQIVQ